MAKALSIIFFMFLASGCAVKKDFYATGGSRADGSIDMAYDFKQFEKPVVSLQQAYGVAKSKCAVWGYSDAEAFGGKTQNCFARNGFGDCIAGQVIVKYQCLGNLDTAAAPVSAPGPGAANGLMSKQQYKDSRLKALLNQNLPYDEYMRQFNAIQAE
ncbi:YecR-like lipofamily protein [Pseudomonas kuykendallii]|uniref:YecR-like lipoprotein n=1 Tax=Pseudomonas kuykendallii TaxID=1007099 RepID=A0A1H2V7T7_9PSED|nr:YecR family lipoprotein [Pseudomonas kuykendallii]MCQ4271278.1 YecR-like lipofamily protein [Pseudomonas kuykendallii]SDW64340.1 YecR-like lipoprotein [Pseudomonas kuykendallii]